MQLKNTLFALSNILDAVEGDSRLGDMDPECRAILKFVGSNTGAGQEVCIKDITNNLHLHGSPVTLMKRIQQLCQAGWLVQGSSDIHHRRVTLHLSVMARRELNAVSTQLETQLAQFIQSKA